METGAQGPDGQKEHEEAQLCSPEMRFIKQLAWGAHHTATVTHHCPGAQLQRKNVRFAYPKLLQAFSEECRSQAQVQRDRIWLSHCWATLQDTDSTVQHHWASGPIHQMRLCWLFPCTYQLPTEAAQKEPGLPWVCAKKTIHKHLQIYFAGKA